MTDIIARRQFAPLYIWLDIAFLCVFLALLLMKKKYMTVLVGLVMGVVYMLVDYGIFHLVCHSRTISEGHSLFLVLLWMSVSYGFTNFTWIWLWLSKDEHLFEWSLLILGWWFCCPLLTQTFAPDAAPIIIQRTTGAYHGYMAPGGKAAAPDRQFPAGNQPRYAVCVLHLRGLFREIYRTAPPQAGRSGAHGAHLGE